MKRGDSVIVTRYGKPGRPRKGVEPVTQPGTVVKSHGRVVMVDFGETVEEVRRSKVRVTEVRDGMDQVQ